MTPKPSSFTPDGAPVGVEYRHVLFSRPKLVSPPRIILIHTNAARGEGSIQSAWNWAHRASGNTCPTYQVDRSGNARKMLRSDEDAICNCTVDRYQAGHGDVSGWSLAIETADTGTDADPGISDFTPAQMETIAQIVAYESILWNIPLVTPTAWYGAGVAGHTDPFGYPLWTCVTGKICPGSKKKASLRQFILPRAIEIRNEWTAQPPAPTPQPQQDDDMPQAIMTHDPRDNSIWVVAPDLSTKIWITQAIHDRLAPTGLYVYVQFDTDTLLRIEDARLAGDSSVHST